MKYFSRISTLDPMPVLMALSGLQAPFADGDWRRTTRHTPHTDSDTLEIVGPPTHRPHDLIESMDLVPTQFFDVPAFRDCVETVAALVHAKPARALLVALRPGGRVKEHVDIGAYSLATDRYHLVIQTNPQSVMVAGNESAYFAYGELWWLEKHARHAACNLGAIPRIHFVLDVWKGDA